MLSAIYFNLDQSKILLSGNGLMTPEGKFSWENKNFFFYLFKDQLHHMSHIETDAWKCPQLGQIEFGSNSVVW